jgi:alpha-D-xyloside xylohydrolase
MRILSHEVSPDGLTIHLDGGLLALTPRTSRTVRVRLTRADAFSEKPSLTVLPVAVGVPAVPFSVVEGLDGITLSTDAITIEVARETAALTYRTTDGALLTREPTRGGKSLTPVQVLRSEFDGTTPHESRENVDGVRIDVDGIRQVVDRMAFHTKLEFCWADGEALYGLGSHEEGMFNLRGQHQYLYQQNLKAVVPVLVSTRGYGVFADCTSLMTFHDDAFGSYLWADVDEELDYYFVVGPEFDEIVAELRRLTGPASMLPKWAFGYVQSKERYTTQAELLEVAREYRARRLPLDCIVLDWKSWTGDAWGQKSLDPVRFPDPGRMTEELHALGVRLMVSIWPIMRPGGGDWRELADGGHLLGNQATYDAFSRDARDAYWRQADRGLFSHGIDAWWSDCTEPFEADWLGAVKPEPEERLRINTEEAKRYLDPEVINAYSLLHSEGIYRGQRATSSTKRVLNLTRSAFPGQQRYGAVTWSGDVSATWDTLRRQIAEGLNFCATGMPYWTTDAGAFFVARRPDLWFWAGDYDAGVDDLGYRELYARWFQYAAWLPMLRSHGTDISREVWRFGDPGDPTYEAIVAAVRLRYRLLPYLYALAGWTTQRAYTMLRSLPFDFRDDPAVFDVADEFMCGPAFLVCPVHAPMAYGPGSVPLADRPRTRSVYLPAGSDWFDLWTERRHRGGQRIEADAPLERIPVFVRAGSIVPMGPVRQHADDLPNVPVELHVYPGRDAAFSLYEDEGDGYGYEDGAFSSIEVTWDDTARCLTVGERQGGFPGVQLEREFVVTVHAGFDEDGAGQPGGRTDTLRLRYAGQRVAVHWDAFPNAAPGITAVAVRR